MQEYTWRLQSPEWQPAAQVLLVDRPHRYSLETAKSMEHKKLERLSETLAADKKLTLLDLIEDQSAKAGAPAPGVRLTRQRTSHEQSHQNVPSTQAAAGTTPVSACCMRIDKAPCSLCLGSDVSDSCTWTWVHATCTDFWVLLRLMRQFSSS